MQPEVMTIEQPPLTKQEVVIDVQHLYKGFGQKKVLEDFNLKVNQGENVVVIGKSGSGKSVLIKCMVGLLYPDKGRVVVLGKNIPDLDRDELDRVRVRMGFLFQNSALYDSMTVRENLEFPMRRHWFHKERADVDALVQEALDNVGLGHTTDMRPSELSGGMRKRIGLARTLILKPDIVLYDEPTTGLDPITGREIVHLIMQLKKKYNTSSIVITHDMEVAHLTANKVVVLHDKQNYLEGTYEEVKQSNDPHVQQFFAKL